MIGFDLRPLDWDYYLGWVEEAPPLQSLLLSPVSPSSEPHSAFCPPPLALHWHTTNRTYTAWTCAQMYKLTAYHMQYDHIFTLNIWPDGLFHGGAESDRDTEKLTGEIPNFGPWKSEQPSFHVPWWAAPPWSYRHSAESRGRTTALPCWPAFWHLHLQRKGWILEKRQPGTLQLSSTK